MIKKLFLVLGLLLLTSVLRIDTKAVAATPSGITISPAFQIVTIPDGIDQQPVNFKITNKLPSAQSISLSVEDFNALNESGGLFFVGSNPTALQKKYGLAKWLELDQDHLTLQPNQTAIITGQIINSPGLSAGGHYGALMVSLGDTAPAPGKVGVKPIASSLLFVTKPAGATYNLSLSDVNFGHSLFSLPKSVNLRFYNDGNSHLVPRGVVSLINNSGKAISKGIINENSNILLPQTYRSFPVTLKNINSANSMGSYKIKVDFRFDGISSYRSYQQSFLHIPKAYVAMLVLAVFAIGFTFLYRRPIARKKISSLLNRK